MKTMHIKLYVTYVDNKTTLKNKEAVFIITVKQRVSYNRE